MQKLYKIIFVVAFSIKAKILKGYTIEELKKDYESPRNNIYLWSKLHKNITLFT